MFSLTQRVRLLRYHLRLNIPVEIAGSSIKIPVIEGEFPQFEGYEDWLIPLLQLILNQRPGAVLDVGTNRGQTLVKIAAIDGSRRYIGFEPNVSAAYSVERIIELNRLERHSIFCVGLADRTSPVELMLSKTGSESNTTAAGVRGAAAYHASKQVLVQCGDDIISRLEPEQIALVKVDVEGAELEALRGLQRTMSRYRPWLVFEVLPPLLVDQVEMRLGSSDRSEVTNRNLSRASDLQTLLEQLNYRFWNIRTSDRRLVPSPSLNLGPDADISMSNFLAVPIEQADTIPESF